MRKFILFALSIALSFNIYAQKSRPNYQFDYKFTTVKANPITPVKNQYRSGTCWAFSTLGFLESEVIRINGIKDTLDYPDFSEFFVVSHSYFDRAVKYVRVDGKMGFSAGSEADDVLEVVRNYGVVPQEAMTGMNYGTEKPEQDELDDVLKAFVDVIVKNPNGKLTTAWKPAVQSILDNYLGECPGNFTVGGRQYTPESYRDALGLNAGDYVTLASFTHHPFYTRFPLEVSDNWRWSEVYNIPIDEFMQVLENAINAGYTAAWGADVSCPGFTRTGYAILVDAEAMEKAGSDQERWTGADNSDEKPSAPEYIEKNPTQESRQIEFDNKVMTDDHGMQIFGIATDQNGKKYYMVKNSWGDAGDFKGIWYASEAFVKGQSLDIIVHKSALPAGLRKKLGIK